MDIGLVRSSVVVVVWEKFGKLSLVRTELVNVMFGFHRLIGDGFCCFYKI